MFYKEHLKEVRITQPKEGKAGRICWGTEARNQPKSSFSNTWRVVVLRCPTQLQRRELAGITISIESKGKMSYFSMTRIALGGGELSHHWCCLKKKKKKKEGKMSGCEKRYSNITWRVKPDSFSVSSNPERVRKQVIVQSPKRNPSQTQSLPIYPSEEGAGQIEKPEDLNSK